jgi:ATP-binding cassette subfamily C (CFTR/MRP) protein 4
VLNGIKIIKMYCWENSFKKIVESLRNQELKYQRNLFLVSTFNQIIDQTLNSAIIFVAVSFFIFFTRLPLLPSYIVIAMSYYMTVSHTIGFFFASEVTMLIAANVSLSRIQDFLLKPDAQKRNLFTECKTPRVQAQGLCASWANKTGGAKGSYSGSEFRLRDLDFEANEKELLAVIGPVGSGKTSLLLAILEELHLNSGELDVQGSVFYVPQEPWIFTASIRQNILFGKLYEDAKFKRVVKACCLEQDLRMFQEAEHTIVGEKGINLSGGQRARINLARALYSDAQIYLFDDPLSAVDASVAKKIYDTCINGYLADKIRILVTHQVHFLAATADRIVYMDEGAIKFTGSFAELAANKEINLNNLHTASTAMAAFSSEETNTSGSIIEEQEEVEEDEVEEGMEMNSSSFSPPSRVALLKKKKRSFSRSHSISSNSPASPPPDNTHVDQRILFSSNSNLAETKNLAASSQFLDLEWNPSTMALNSVKYKLIKVIKAQSHSYQAFIFQSFSAC